MKTRFDTYGKWITGNGELMFVRDMSTTHILNTMRMLIQKPSRTMSMLISDVEGCVCGSPCQIFPLAWEPDLDDVLKKSIYNITSMSADELKTYVRKTPLFQSFCDELSKRGVNVENIVDRLHDCEAF